MSIRGYSVLFPTRQYRILHRVRMDVAGNGNRSETSQQQLMACGDVHYESPLYPTRRCFEPKREPADAMADRSPPHSQECWRLYVASRVIWLGPCMAQDSLQRPLPVLTIGLRRLISRHEVAPRHPYRVVRQHGAALGRQTRTETYPHRRRTHRAVHP